MDVRHFERQLFEALQYYLINNLVSSVEHFNPTSCQEEALHFNLKGKSQISI